MKKIITTIALSITLFSCQKTEKNGESQANSSKAYNKIDENGLTVDTTSPTPQTYTPPVELEAYNIPDAEGYTTLYKLSKVFVDKPSEDEIERYMNKALDVYGLERTDENYNKVGSALVDLRMNSSKNITEMDILKYTIKIHVKNAKIPDMMAMASVYLEN